jgi:uroporphyrinogen-III synthase
MDIKKQRVLITRPDHQSEQFVQKLKTLEAQPITFPVIKISASTETEALDRALSQLQTYDWLVLTSVNAVDAVWSRLQDLEIKELPVSLRVAAVGPQTAGALRAHRVTPDFVPDFCCRWHCPCYCSLSHHPRDN